ncbi:MAG: hemerythrin domain-containing protein [Candidatus Thiodiazotropha sp. 'RUGA']|nr:hemerythrin domain-containing protein [Candidatus Thiodiazotropha sp. 'RUGA']
MTMINIEWHHEYEIGYERIDFEHKIFLGLISDASLALDLKLDRQRILQHLEEIKQYTVFHFISEENIMLDIDYPELQHHKQEHQVLLARLNDKIHQYRNEALDLEAIVDFLFEWFALHTTQVDTKIGRYIKATDKNAAFPFPPETLRGH